MTSSNTPSKALHYSLWTAQVLLSASLLWAAGMKLFQPIEKLSAMWPWTGQVSPAVVTFTGLVDLLAALGLVLPMLFSIRPKLTGIAALGLVLLMICATVFHVLRGEVSLIGANIVFSALAAFVAWGRFRS